VFKDILVTSAYVVDHTEKPCWKL